MARNKLAGTGTSYKKRGMTPASIAKKLAYDKKYQKKKVKERAQLNKLNRDAGTYGNGDKKDVSHKKNGKTVKEPQSKNRARNGQKKGKNPSKARRGTRK